MAVVNGPAFRMQSSLVGLPEGSPQIARQARAWTPPK
jgi:hypothetical protein